MYITEEKPIDPFSCEHCGAFFYCLDGKGKNWAPKYCPVCGTKVYCYRLERFTEEVGKSITYLIETKMRESEDIYMRVREYDEACPGAIITPEKENE